MELSALLALMLGFGATPQVVTALAAGDADTMYDSFNAAFLTTSGSDVYYMQALDNTAADGTWSASLDILGAEDAYEVTGDSDKQTVVNNLLVTWLQNTPPPWSWDGYNDDIGWFTLALIRGYQMTGNTDFLNEAVYGFNYAFGRGWDTQYNGGGIWEENPSYAAQDNPPNTPCKSALANDSLGKVACYLYQSTHNVTYLDTAQQIYSWVWNNLYEQSTGQINTCVYEDGTVDTSTAAYSQGTWLDFANLLYEITGNVDYYNDATNAINFGMNSLTVNGIFSNSASYLNTWADEMARGAGHFVRDNQLWGTYYSWMVDNANAILENELSSIGLTWNAWAQATPDDTSLTANNFVSAMAWLQYTPATQPNSIGGIHVITNQETGMAIDSEGSFGNGENVVQWGLNNGQNQRWQLTQNSDTSWNIISLSTWQSLDCPGGSNAQNLTMDQWQPTRNSNQRWWIDQQSNGNYKIWNQESGLALDGSSSTDNGYPLTQWGWNGGPQQLWILH